MNINFYFTNTESPNNNSACVSTTTSLESLVSNLVRRNLNNIESSLDSMFSNFLRSNSNNIQFSVEDHYFIPINNPSSIVTTSLTLADINQYTILTVFNSNTVTNCSICFNNFNPGDICRKINRCSHTFHQSCVDSWLYRQNTCPLCRLIISSENIQT